MRSGASTPEELESLFEDALMMGDRRLLGGLFETATVLVSPFGSGEVRGGARIASHACALRDGGYVYLADSRRVLQARDTALLVAQQAVNVMRRGADRRCATWSLL
ncbi:MAG: hypothetical protein ACRDNS_20570 [Trebonia sp.]